MASTIRKLRRASWAERRALARAGVLLLLVRGALVALPFRTVLRLVEGATKRSRRRADVAELSRDVWAVEVVGNRLFPRNPCLTQAVVVQGLFRRAGRPAEIRIGVRRVPSSPRPQAHAWVESEGAVVIGSAEAAHGYVPFPPLPRHG